jgi:hypothetical protein
MRRREFAMIRSLLLTTFTLVSLSPALALDMNQVPPHVLEVANHYAPGATWEKFGTDFDTLLGAPEYEITGKDKAGNPVEVDVSPSGDLHEIETVISADAVSAPVMKLLNAYLPGFKPTLVEMSARPNNVTFYEFEGMVDGREVDVEVSAAGNEILVADDSAI